MQDRTGSRAVPGADREALVFLPWMQRLIHFPIFACPGDRSFTGQSSEKRNLPNRQASLFFFLDIYTKQIIINSVN